MNKTRTLVFDSGPGAATFTWKCDDDYNFVGVHAGTGIQVMVSTSGQAVPVLATKQSWVNGDVLFASTTTTMSSIPIQKTFLAKNTTITVAIGAGSELVTVVLEYFNP